MIQSTACIYLVVSTSAYYVLLRVNRAHASNALLLSSLQAETGEPEGQPSSHLPHAANTVDPMYETETETRRLASQPVLQRQFSCTDVEVAQTQVPQQVPPVDSKERERRRG
ncbi:hypothetical protein HDV63DRAFT_373608 [Trichoderma sp. SZMC 28014]